MNGDQTPPGNRIPPPGAPPRLPRPRYVIPEAPGNNRVRRRLQNAFDVADHEEAERRLAPTTPPRNHPHPPQNNGGDMEGGGKVKKAGMYMLKKNDVVLPADRVKEVNKALKMAGMKLLK